MAPMSAALFAGHKLHRDFAVLQRHRQGNDTQVCERHNWTHYLNSCSCLVYSDSAVKH